MAAGMVLFFLQSVAAQTDPGGNPMTIAAAPVLDLNGPGTGSGFAAIYTEDQPPVAITSSALTLTYDEGPNLTEALITLTNIKNPNLETLAAVTTGTLITASYDPATGLLRLSNSDTIANYIQVLKTVTYQNASQAPDITDRSITFAVLNGVQSSATVTSTVSINAVNDAPKLASGANLRMTDIAEDDMSQQGNTVQAILESDTSFGNPISDVDPNPQQGVAVIEVGSSNGTWQYSTNGGTSWQPFGAVSNQSAVLLTPEARIRFLPNANFSGQASFTLRAWDRTSGTPGSTGVDVSINGGATAFSAGTDTAVQTVTPVNDLPLVDLNGELPGTSYSTSYVAGNPPVNITAGDAYIIDVDSSELISATIRLANRPDGPAEILQVDTTSTTITAATDANGALQLTGTAVVSDYVKVLRTVTYSNSAVPITTDPRIVEVTVSDGVDTSETVTSTISVQPANSAPELIPDAGMVFTAIDEDNVTQKGDTVAALIAGAPAPPITDVDSSGPFGFAVVGTDSTNGTWEYSIDGGTSWTPFGNVAATAAALLNADARIRFLPATDYFGEAGGVTVRAWDLTSGNNGSTGIDTSTNGGSSAFSSTTTTIPITVMPVNDAPALSIGAINPIFREGDAPVEITGPSLQLTDVDGTTLESATIKIENLPASEPERLWAETGGTGITAAWNAGLGRLRLTGTASVADYQSVLRSITFENTSQSPDTTPREITIIANDGALNSNKITLTVEVQSVNDPPELDLNGSQNGENFRTTFNTETDVKTAVGGDIVLRDVDNTTMASAVVKLVDAPDGVDEILDAQRSGTNINITFDPATHELRLSGSDTIANYEKVLATVSYLNTAVSPTPSRRVVTFTVMDGIDGSSLVKSTITLVPMSIFLPVNIVPRSDEPNNACGEAFPLQTDKSNSFAPNDANDWYRFELENMSGLRVELSNFVPEEGQILLLAGSCGNLRRVANNGNFAMTKIIEVGPQPPGTYFIWIINDGPKLVQKYDLIVKTR